MPWNKVMGKFKAGKLHSGSKKGPEVTDPKQAVAIMMSEKAAAAKGKKEYKAKGKPGGVFVKARARSIAGG